MAKNGQSQDGEPPTGAEPNDTKSGVPESVVAELRADRRELREEVQQLTQDKAQLEQRLEALETKAAPAQAGPLAQWNAENPGIPPDASVVEQELAYREQKAKEAQEAQSKDQRMQAAQRSLARARSELSEEISGKGLDFDSVLKAGEANLTAGDKLDIANAGDNAMQLAYERCIQRTAKLQTLREAHQKAKAQAVKDDNNQKGEPKTELKHQTQEEYDPAYSRIMSSMFGSS